jgi:HD-GYP domain-containing protein (c-di-GMP phosphodiesterase class II)
MTESVAAFPKKLAGYCAIVTAVAVALVVGLVAAQGWPNGWSLFLFCALAIFSVNRAVIAPGEGVSFLPVDIVLTASIVVFDHDGTMAGTVLVGLAAGFYLPALHRKSLGWVPFNGANWACSVAAAAAVYALLRHFATQALPVALVGLIPAVLAFFAALLALIVVSYVVERERRPRDVAVELLRQDVGEIPFAVLGILLGRLYLSIGAAAVLLIIVPILIAREMFASYLRVKESHDETVGMLIHALEAKDRYTSGHSERVADYARYIGEELNFMPARLERLRFAALMHDIGKLVVPNQLLNKPGRLTPDEFSQVRVHEKVSVQMLSHIDFLRPIAAASHSDSTRFDPDDLDHPIEPYIVMIADAYDAMTSTRAYRKALPQDVAFRELRDNAGVQFHPACVEALIHAVEKRGERHGAGFETDAEFENAPVAGVGSAGLGDLLESGANDRTTSASS